MEREMKHIKCLTLMLVFSIALFGVVIAGQKISNKSFEGQKVESEILPLTIQSVPVELQQIPQKAEKAISGAKGGGETILTATVIPSLPYIDVGNTSTMVDDYDPTGFDCSTPTGMPDAVYSYSPVIEEFLNVKTCNSAYWTEVYIFENSEANLVECNHWANDSCGATTPDNMHAAVFMVHMVPPNTYYIVVDGFNGGSGEYELEAFASPPVDTQTVHPAIAQNADDHMFFTYEYNAMELESNIYYYSIVSDTLYGGLGWMFTGVPTFPAVDNWGPGSIKLKRCRNLVGLILGIQRQRLDEYQGCGYCQY
jgi:hypothetical protein